ncbi:type VI secretion system protein TssL, short form [Enterobacter mori]|uniref:type VI secretion system protein TssL, short form n=1 Tax=Enterobacter mori TaxID=539813 RepID=UPI003AACE784
MSERKRGAAASIDIDALLQNTWLQVISLRHGPTFQNGEGRTLWERCIADVERVQRELKTGELDEASCRHILTAQCALLDEAVKGRGVEDDACVQWYDIPLQGHFLGTMDAGDTLCDRMRDVLREPAPDPAVVTCFQRVMLLGLRPDWGRQLSVMVSVCPQQHPDSEALTSRLLTLRWHISQLRKVTGHSMPLVLNGQVGSAMTNDVFWQAVFPGEGVRVWRESSAPGSVAEWVTTGGTPAIQQQVLMNSLMNWFRQHVQAVFMDENPDVPVIAPAAVLWGMGPILAGSLATSAWTTWLSRHTAMQQVSGWQPVGTDSTVISLFPDFILPLLPEGRGLTPRERTWRCALGLFTLAAIAALLSSGWNNRQLLRRVSFDISRLFSELIADLPVHQFPENASLVVILDASSSLPLPAVRNIWQEAWQESGITCALEYTESNGPGVVNHWLDHRIKDDAMLLIVGLQIDPAVSNNTAETAVALLLGNRLTQEALEPLALLHRPDAAPTGELREGMNMAAYNVPLKENIVKNLWLAGLTGGQRAEVIACQNAHPAQSVEDETVISLDTSMGHAGAAAPWLSVLPQNQSWPAALQSQTEQHLQQQITRYAALKHKTVE